MGLITIKLTKENNIKLYSLTNQIPFMKMKIYEQ